MGGLGSHWFPGLLAVLVLALGAPAAPAPASEEGAGEAVVGDEVQKEEGSVASSPVQFGIANPLQAVPESWAIRGVRLGGFTRNASVHGADVGFVNSTAGHQSGFQGGFYNHVGGDLVGLQFGATYSEAEGAVRGLQLSGATNSAGSLRGGQLSAVNVAGQVRGGQLGVVNYAESLKGIQFGLLNVNRDGWIPILPLVNFGF